MTNFWAACLIAAASLGQVDTRPEVRFGLPEGRIRCLPSYVVVWNGRTRCPDLVVEYLDARRLEGSRERTGRFRADPEVPIEFRPTPADYAGSGYDIGHMAPYADHKRSDTDAAATFNLSNACPQLHGVNAGVWLRIEKAVRELAKRQDVAGVWVYSGPLWWAEGDKSFTVQRIGRGAVWVPTHYFKVIVAELSSGELRTWALLVPHRERLPSPEPLASYAVSIDEIETASGLDLLTELNDTIEGELEAAIQKPFER